MFLQRIVTMFIVILATCLFLFTGCSNVTQENYDKLKAGMSFDEVADLLGGPWECSSALGAKNCTWDSNGKSVKIKFIADKIVFYSSTGL